MGQRKKTEILTDYQKLEITTQSYESKSVGQIADYLGVSYQAVYGYVLDNNLPAKIISTSIRSEKAKAAQKAEIFNVYDCGEGRNWLI